MQLPREPRLGSPLDAAWGAQVVRYIRAITPQNTATVSVRETAGGTLLDVRTARGGRSGGKFAPFDIAIGSDLKARFRAGTINGLLPSNYLTGVTVPASGTKYLVLNCTAANGQITSAAFAADATPPPALTPYAGQPPVSFKLLIGILIDGVATKVWADGNIQAAGTESFRLQKAAPVAGQLPYDVYYTWNLSVL